VCGINDLVHTCDEYLVLLAKSGMTEVVKGRCSEAERAEGHTGRNDQSHYELLMEMSEEYGLNVMGENDEDEDGDDEGNAARPLHLCHLLLRLWRSSKRKPKWRWILSKRPLWRMR
jgi:hypothetical protein